GGGWKKEVLAKRAGRRPGAVRHFPGEILTSRRPRRREAGFGRGACPAGTTPLGPAVAAHEPACTHDQYSRKQHGQRGEWWQSHKRASEYQWPSAFRPATGGRRPRLRRIRPG